MVEIKEIKLDYTAPAGKPDAWKEAEEKYYINLQDDPDGRKIKLTLSEKIKDIPVYFMLAEDKNNRKAVNWG